MNKIISFFLLVFVFYGCNDIEESSSVDSKRPLAVSAQFLKLSDDNNIAGELSIVSNMDKVHVKWNTDSICNLDTTQTVVYMKNGTGRLPIKWEKQQENGKYGPEYVAYKAGVLLTDGENSKYVPLVWSEKIDSTKIVESIPLTRSVDSPLPRVVQIQMIPTTVHMNYQTGGVMYVKLDETPFAVFDVSDITSEMNIDMSQIPTSITSSQLVNFKWNANGAPSLSFTAQIIAYGEGITQIGAVTYTIPNTLSFVKSNLPTGNIPYVGDVYTFSFEGGYAGAVQVRCLVNGTVANTGSAVMNKQPQVTVPGNNTINTRSVTFQYKRADGNWENLPTSENRIQNGYTDYILVAGVKWAKGNLQYRNGVYSFMNSQELYTGRENVVWSAANNPDYWAANTLTPATVYKNNGDPCRKVAPAGTWRLPTKTELNATAQSGHVSGFYNNVKGTYFGIRSLPSTIAQPATLFLPYAGLATYINNYQFNGCAWGGLYRGTGGSNNATWLVFYDNDAIPMAINEISNVTNDPSGCNSGATIRCVRTY